MTSPRLRRRLTMLGAGILVAALASGTAAPAYAKGGHNPSDTNSMGAAVQSDIVDQYSSLSAALINMYATNSGKTIEQYLKSQQILLSAPSLLDPTTDPTSVDPNADPSADPSTLPTDPTDPNVDPNVDPGTGTGDETLEMPTVPALGTADALGNSALTATPLQATSFSDLNAQLKAAGVTIDTKGYKSLDALARSVLAKSNTADGAVTLAGAKWMRQLATLRTPKLTAPTAVSANMPGLPKDSLVFGLFADKSLTNLVNSNPGLFASAKSSGLGSAKMQKAWQQSMLSAYNASREDWSNVLPDPCTGGMLAVMASGNASAAKKVGSGCNSACVTGGLYLNSQMSSLFSPGTSSTFGNPYSSLWNSTTLNGLQRWQQKQLLEQNPQLTNQLLSDTQPSASASCSASSKATKNALGASLPGIFGQLRTQ